MSTHPSEALTAFNATISSLGYSGVSARDHMTLVSALGEDLGKWLAVCVARPAAKGMEFHSLRSALFGVSTQCHAALLAHDLDLPAVALVKWLVQRGETGRQMIRFLGSRQSGREVDAVRNEVRNALLGGAANTSMQADAIKERTMKVHGTRYALTVEQTWNVHSQAVLQVEMAAKVQSGRYDWTNKISLQLSDHEIVGVLDVLIGQAVCFEVSNHGREQNKSFRIEAQSESSGIYVNVRQMKNSLGVLMPKYQAFRFVSLATRAVKINNPGMSAEEILAVTKIVGGRFAAA